MKANDKQKKKVNTFTIIAIVVILVGMTLVATGIILLSKPKSVFKESFNYMSKSVKVLSMENNLSSKIATNDKIKWTNNIDISLNESLQLGLKKINLNLEVLENKKEKTSKYYLDTKLDNQNLVELISYLKDEKLYLYIANILDKYYYTNMDYISLFESINQKNVDIIINEFTKALDEALIDGKFTKEKTKVEVDGLEENLTKLSLRVDDILLSEIITKTINNIKNNDNALNALADLLGIEKEKVTKTLDETIEEVKDTTGETLFTYNMYYKNINTVRKLELLSGTSVITYTGNDNRYRLKYTESGENVLTLLLTENKNNYKIALDMENVIAEGTLTINNNTYNMSLNLQDIEDNNLGTLIVSYTAKSTEESQINIIYKMENIDIINMNISTKYTFGENITAPNLTTSKNLEEMTEEELTTILTNINNHQILGPLMQSLSTLMGNNLLSDNYQNEYNY